MIRGRLEIFDPNGPVENFFIDKEVVAIGRSVGNDLVLDRHGISRYHLKLVTKDQQAYVEDLDSVNGTYIDGIRIKASESRILRGGEEIQMGDLRLVFHPPEDLDATVAMVTQRIEIGTFQVELEGPNIAVTPGTHAPAILKIKNSSPTPQRITVKVDGIPKEWTRVDRSEVEVPAQEQVQVGIAFKPLRRPETTPGEYPITVTVTSEYNPPIEMTTRLQILSYSGYGAVIGTPFLTDKQPLKMYVHNQGNGPLNLRFRGVSRGPMLNFDLQPVGLTLAPGERQTIGGTIQLARPKWFGKSQVFNYDIVAHSLDAATFQAPLSGQFQTTPLLPGWAPLAAILGTGIIGLLLLLLVISLTDEPGNSGGRNFSSAPTITQFELSRNDLDLNDPLLMSWQADQVNSIWVQINRTGQAGVNQDLPTSNQTNFPIQLPSAGLYELKLVAENSRGQTEQTLYVAVHPQTSLTVSTSPDDRNILYRNLNGQQLQVEWQVVWSNESAGAAGSVDEPDISLLIPRLTVEQPETASPGPKVFDVPVLTSLDAVAVILRVIGPDNIQSEESVIINVSYPQCMTASEPQSDYYREPSADSSLMGVLPSNVMVNVEARDQSGEWLYIQIPPERVEIALTGWVQTVSLTCVGFSPEQLIVVNDPVPQALPANTPSPTQPIPTVATSVPVPSSSATATLAPTATQAESNGQSAVGR